MSNNNLIQQNTIPTKNERLAAVLLYLFLGYFGDLGWGVLLAFHLINSVTDIPYFLRFHFSQAISNGLLALPVILFILAPIVIDELLHPISNAFMYISFGIGGLFFLSFIVIDLYCAYFAYKGEMRRVLPKKLMIRF
jgi:hypothetical protein